MPILVLCECGRQLRARDELAGRRCRCPACGTLVTVPPPPVSASDGGPRNIASASPSAKVPAAPPAPPAPPLLGYAGTETPFHAEPLVHGAAHPLPVIARAPVDVERLEKSWRGNLFWLLLLAMIPLAWITLQPRVSVMQRLEKTLATRPALRDQFGSGGGGLPRAAVEELLATLPGKRLDGALLGRTSVWHWLMALVSAGLFTAIVRFALPTAIGAPQVLLTGFFTGTLGVFLLLGVQFFAMFCCLGGFYRAALDPSAPFGPSLLGFVLTVGASEEVVKCLPVLWKLFRRQLISWRAAAVIGMASGAGFGISEGIWYATRQYNGLEGADVYFVRFLSSVALHTVLSGACAIMIQRKQEHLFEDTDFFNWFLTLLAIILMPIFLHGLFNTLAKHDLPAAALAVALGSFVWLWYLIRLSRKREQIDVAAMAAALPTIVKTAKGTRYIAPS
jgi:RsiW-degrading membrane proteinase PrsW (M82 family)